MKLDLLRISLANKLNGTAPTQKQTWMGFTRNNLNIIWSILRPKRWNLLSYTRI